MTTAPAARPRTRWLLPTLAGYQWRWLTTDIVAGIAAGAVVVPQAMAYATIANLPVQIGLYTCMAPMLVYALLGGSRAMSVSTTSTIATLTATTFVSAGIAAVSTTPQRDLVTLTLMVGVILLLARVFRLGSLIEMINEATLIGLKVGLGATVALGQVPKLLGVDVQATGHGFIRTIVATVEAVPKTSVPTLLLSVGSILVLVLLRRFAPRVPGQLVIVAVAIILVAFFDLRSTGIAVIPRVPGGVPLPALPDFTHVVGLVPGALAIAVMAFLETASVARGIRRAGEPQVDSNRELLANGAANLVGAFFQSLPAAGGFSQSAVNQRAGARSQLSALVTVVLAVLIALFLAPVLDNLPQATLAAMVFVAVIGLIDVRGLARLARINTIEFWIAIVTAAIGLAAGLLPAVAAGVVFTLGAVLHELGKPHFDVTREGATLVVSLQLSLYTASVLPTERAIEALLDADPGIRTLVIDAAFMRSASVTVLDALAEFDHELDERGVRLEVHNLAGDALQLAGRTEWWATLEREGRAGAITSIG